jgi:hypothetical protein
MAAAPAAFNAALIQIGFSQEAVASINQNQVTVSENLIGMTKDNVEQLVKIVRGGHGVPVITVLFMAQKRFATFCYWVNRRSHLGEDISSGLFTPQAVIN